MKKILSVMLAILMIVTTVPAASFAADAEFLHECTHESVIDGKCVNCGSACAHKSYTSAEEGNCPDCGALITGRPLIIDVSKSDNTQYYVGGDYSDSVYDEDGIIFTGYNENVGIDILEGCNLTFDNLTVDNVNDAAADDTVYITLKGVNEMKKFFGFYKADFIVDGDEDAVLKFDNMSTGGNDGTFTLNGGNLILDMETDMNIPTLNNEALVINGGSVTASNNYTNTLSCPVELNSGTLNIISTASDCAAIDDKVIMKKGALLTVSTESTMLSDWYGTGIEISETENENSFLFVRYDKESAFVPVSDIKAALEGKHYAEIKVDSHTHLYENGKCVCGLECAHETFENQKCTVCGIDCLHNSYTDGKCVNCGSVCAHKSYTSAEDGNCPDCGVLITGRPLIIDVSKSDNMYYYVGGDFSESIYDEDGIIFTGYNENVGIDILEGCKLTFDNLTVDNVDDSAADDTVYITLKGVNEMKRYFGFYKADFIVDGDEDAVLKFDNMSTDGNDGTFTLNGGNLILDMETDVNIPTLNNEALVINGGSVTASNNYSYTLSCPVELNSGTLNIISTASDSAAIDDKVIMKKGALLTVSTESTMLSYWYGTGIAISETENENSFLFVRYDKESAFVPVSDIKAALEGKHYAEIKVDSHTHLYENGKCVCGLECAHETFENQKCTVCGIDCPHNSYTDGKCSACGKVCSHNSYTDSLCDTCGKECPHNSYTDAKCSVCGADCIHNNITDNICTDCQTDFSKIILYVGGVLAESSNYNDILGSADSGATARYNPETNTLTLENFSFSGTSGTYGGIFCDKSLNIELKGKNTIAVSGEMEAAIHIHNYIDDIKLVVSGDGELVLSSEYGDGIYAESNKNCELEIKDSAKIKITAESDGIDISGEHAGLTVKNNAIAEIAAVSEGIRLEGDTASLLVKDNGKIIINGDDEGIYISTYDDCSATFTDNAEVSITTTDEEGIYAFSEEGESTITVSGNADVHIDGEEEGIYAGKVIVTGGTLDTSGTGTYVGIMAEKLEISGGAVKATGGDEAAAISADEITVTGGSLEAKTSADLPACSVAPDFSGYKTEKKLYASVNADGSDLVEYKAEDNDKYKYFCLECVHKEATDKGFEATCSKTGLTDGSHCTVCGMILTAQKEIPVVSHKDTNGDYKCDFGCGYEFPKPVEPTTKPSEPSTEPTTKPNVEDTTKPSTEPTTKPGAEETTKPTETTKPAEPTTTPSTEEPTTQHTHTEVVIPAVKATYTADGLTAGKKCSECGEILVKQKKVARKKLKKVTSLKKKSVKLASGTKTTLTLSWKKVTGAEKYVVERYVNKKWKTVATTKKTYYTVKKLKANKSYKFRVRAKAGKYYGSYSNTYTAKTVPLTPTLTVKAGKKQLTASWKTVANITGYEVQYSTSKKFTKKTTKKVTIKKAKTKKTTIKKLKKGKKYFVKVRVYKTVGKKKIYGSWSTVKTVKVK